MIDQNLFKEMGADQLRVLLWLFLCKRGGAVRLTRADFESAPLTGQIVVLDGADEVVVRAVVAGNKNQKRKA